jgi:hypothetical protein
MSQISEINLRIPSLRVRREGKEAPETIANADVRFCRQIELDAIPKAGQVLTLEIEPGRRFECEVVRSEWRDDKNMFVIACRYSNRSITPADYQAFLDSPDWQARPLL